MTEAERLDLIARFAGLLDEELARRGKRWRRRPLDELAYDMSEHADELLCASRPSEGKVDPRKVERLAVVTAVDVLTLWARQVP